MIYSIRLIKLKIVKTYIKINLTSNFIRLSKVFCLATDYLKEK